MPQNFWPDDYPPGHVYYNGELIKLPEKRLTKEQQLCLVETHPCLTGVCRECGYQFPERPPSWCNKRIKFYNL